jgi:hypothetical protein
MVDYLSHVAPGAWCLALLVPVTVFSMYLLSVLARPLGRRCVPDKAVRYSPEQLRGWFDGYGPEGRARYLLLATGLDLVYCVLYTATFVSVIRRLEIGLPWPWQVKVALLALSAAGGILDALENRMLIRVLTTYWAADGAAAPVDQAGFPALARRASRLTTAKWAWLVANVLGILLLLWINPPWR